MLSPAVVIAALAGFASLTAQFAFNRVIFFYIANSEYSTASILTLHLGGFFLGSLLARRFSAGPLPLLAAHLLTSLAAYFLVWRFGITAIGLPVTIGLTVAFSFSNACFAGWILLRLIRNSKDGREGGAILASEALGSVGGAALAGFLIVPRLGLSMTFATVCLTLMLGLILAAKGLWLRGAIFAIAIAVMAATFLPAMDQGSRQVIRSHGYPLPLANENFELDFSQPSPFGVVSLVRAKNTASDMDGRLSLRIDSRALCGVPADGKGIERQSEWILGDNVNAWVKARALHGETAIVGLGCGTTLSSVLRNPSAKVKTIEINPVIAEAQPRFESRLKFKLNDPRHALIAGDGFRYFLESDSKFSSIILDVAWMQNLNATHLFSQEMFRNVRRSLASDGIFVVWSEEYDPFSAVSKILYRTLRAEFPLVIARSEIDGAVVFYALAEKSGEAELAGILGPESAVVTKYLERSSADWPVNTLDNLVLNRAKFTWLGDSKFDRILSKYE